MKKKMTSQKELPMGSDQNAETPTQKVNNSHLHGETRALARLKARSIEADNHSIYFG